MIRRFRGEIHIDMHEVAGVREGGCFGLLILKSGAVIETSAAFPHVLHEFRASRGVYPNKPEGANDYDSCSWGDYK